MRFSSAGLALQAISFYNSYCKNKLRSGSGWFYDPGLAASSKEVSMTNRAAAAAPAPAGSRPRDAGRQLLGSAGVLPGPINADENGDLPIRETRVCYLTRAHALSIAVRAGLAQPVKQRILSLAYPIEASAFWQTLAGLGLSEESLMDRLGASP